MFELSETGVTFYKNSSYQAIYDTIAKLHESVEEGGMTQLTKIGQLSAGIIFFLRTPRGWTRMGERHLGFYFTSGDRVEMISDRNAKMGVGIETFGKQEFFDKFSRMSGCFVSSNKG